RAQEGSHGVVEDLQDLLGGHRPERDHDRGGHQRDEHPARHVPAVSNQPPRQQGTQVRPDLGGGPLRCRRRGRGGVGGSVQSNAVDGHGCLLGRRERFLRGGTAGAAVARGGDGGGAEGGAGWGGGGGSGQGKAVAGHGGLLGRGDRVLGGGTAGAAGGRGGDGGWDEGGAGWHGIGWASAQIVISRTARPGKMAKMMTRGRTRNTTGMSIVTSRRPAVSMSSRLEVSRASCA